MSSTDVINYWIECSNEDYKTMKNLYRSKDYTWCLFIGHLVIEKLLKALYVKCIGSNVPRTHDLLRLAVDCKLVLTTKKEDSLDLITTFNISARYPDYKKTFFYKCDKEYTDNCLDQIEEMRIWILSILNL